MSKRSPRVSVVMPAFNAEGYLSQSVASVIAQSEQDWELLIVDDASTDRTFSIAESFARADLRIRAIRSPRNFGGPAGPRNIGVREATAEWIAFLDADDLWHPEKLRIQLGQLHATRAQFCSSAMFDFMDGQAVNFSTPRSQAFHRIGFLSQLVKFRTPTSSVVCSRSLLLRHPFNESPSYKAREDMDCWLACIEEVGDSIKIREALVAYRKSANQISRGKFRILLRHFHVLRHYRRQGGAPLGWLQAAVFTLTHCLYAVPFRLMMGRM